MNIKLFTIPNVLTLANLLCGSIAAIYSLVYNDLKISFIFIIIAGVFDFLDGFTARALKSYSEIGKQLDSLSDMVSFGFAPSAILYTIYMGSGGEEWWYYGSFGVFLVTLFSALRLAKFNIDETQTEEFTGLPTPAAAIFIASAGWIFQNGGFEIKPLYILIVSVCLSYLLISPIRMFSFKFHNFSFKANSLRYTFLAVSAALLIIFGINSIPFIIMGYVLTSIIRSFSRFQHN